MCIRDSHVSLSYRGRQLTRPAPVNRDSVLELERGGRLAILWASQISGLGAGDGGVRVLFEGPDLSPRQYDRVVYALGGTTPENFLKSVGIEFDGPSSDWKKVSPRASPASSLPVT